MYGYSDITPKFRKKKNKIEPPLVDAPQPE